MAIVQILNKENPALRKIATPVETINDHIIKLVSNMFDTMYYSGGVGLAAPQIGYSRRVIVVDTGEDKFEIINPTIIESSGVQNGIEGCLSVPRFSGVVERYKSIVVTGKNISGEDIRLSAQGYTARVIQHEIDHLNGILFTDKATKIERD